MLTTDPIDTPALVVDLGVLERNLARLAAECAAASVAFRPHSKTHKSPWFAARQCDLGASGICAAKLGEAEVHVGAGIADVLVTTELEPGKLGRLLDLCELGRVSVVAEDPEAVVALARSAARRGLEVPVLVDVNVGQNRCGVDTLEETLAVAQAADAAPGVRFAGLQGFEGNLQHVQSVDERRRRAFEAYDRLGEIRDALVGRGLEVGCVSTAGTGTYRFALEHEVPTEVQAGSYVFSDARYNTIDGVEFENALFVVTGVVGRKREGQLIVDAGFKSVSTDDGMPKVAGDADATYEVAGDEHGRIHGLGPETDRVWLVPSHCDTTVNLYDRYVLVRDGCVVGELPVAARGRVR
jgi:3-hydroxy-D-aspartate aldolase